MPLTAAQQRLFLAAVHAEQRVTKAVRRKCFISYHAADADEVTTFVQKFEDVIIPKIIGVTDDDPWVDSTNTDYIMDKVREKYLTDSTVTIVMVGKCTWARKYVDWEVYSSLRNDKNNRRNGLMAIELPSRGDGKLPPRVSDNFKKDSNDNNVGYARYWVYPGSDATLRGWVEDAFEARTNRSHLIDNTHARKTNNSPCP